ncbi:MAG TPA: NapC/NirT family cytochrome c [Myxococcota bacterium]
MTEANQTPHDEHRRNWLLLLGILLAVGGFLSGLFLFALELILEAASYLGALYLLITAIFLAGVALIPLGLLNARTKGGLRPRQRSWNVHFELDLNKRNHLYGTLALLVSGPLILFLLGFGSYRSYQATESPGFCGELCHSVMHPEWTTYQTSSHARVACVECHIGEGADWFVRSKIDGLRQVWAVTVNSYSRPIPTPIHNLRPARETCEECHWPQKFIGYKELIRPYYLGDEENTPHHLRMLVKIGGEQTGFMKGSGIHYHMLIASKVEYVATDERRQDIAWVRVTRADGSVTEFNNTSMPLAEEERSQYEVRTMDCMDCHNRPAHQFQAPMSSVNMALDQGAMPRTLPYIKVQAVKALSQPHETTEEAMVGIANYLRTYYREEYPDVLETQAEEVAEAIQATQAIYRGSIFPIMDADWSAYPNNIGHHYSRGCFRCHNEDMQSSDGEVMFDECNDCHLILAQGESIDEVNVDFNEGLPFVHPADGDTIEEFMDCVDCHSGGGEVYE